MSFRSIVKDVRDGLGSLSRRGFEARLGSRQRAEPNAEEVEQAQHEPGCWASLPPELLRDVMKRVEASEGAWPARRSVVACAAVCRAWRLMCREIVGTPEMCAKLTFPGSLKQPGPRTSPIQCYIKRNKASSTYHLYLGLNTENGKFLLAARKIRRPTHAEYVISLDPEDMSRTTGSYIGKLRSNFLGTKFAVYDSQPPYAGAIMSSSSSRSSRRFYSRRVSPKMPTSGSYGVAHVAYELNMLGSRGPRRMRCTMHSIPASALDPSVGPAPAPEIASLSSLDESFSTLSFSHSMDRDLRLLSKRTDSFSGSARFSDITSFRAMSGPLEGKEWERGPLVLKNKAPRWHEQLQCWCLNFRGRVTVASVKNFQLIAAVEPPTTSEPAPPPATTGSSDHDKILLQFGKIGKDLFTMDYRYPLSAFQAFAICLSSFDTKLACE
ncbi:hypothetical protein AMTRI_Chr09g19200 [Amborella trichopoda]|uniref:Tubby-like F-box protein n=1 Tax=Amborella trichopoda TaxID=13333 RepID=W1PSZ7_AMBTC|nr:tubby-like F-box protein 14 [Amborella trichopoda]ERN10826.1 hypothetical protein AMTR_s00027p00237390 [Amborella trichopoda]|eukprot:XP_006849245.1 tubby-like F-box protein 14 [Amborella trichopoda]